jgi:hypothetical protein
MIHRRKEEHVQNSYGLGAWLSLMVQNCMMMHTTVNDVVTAFLVNMDD